MLSGEWRVPEFMLKDLEGALARGEPRAMELAYALALSLPEGTGRDELKNSAEEKRDDENGESEKLDEVLVFLREAVSKYWALSNGTFKQVDMGNPTVLGFERESEGERLLIVNNLAPVSQPAKFAEYAGRGGWDILNRVEFVFPARAQLEAYEFLWLLVE